MILYKLRITTLNKKDYIMKHYLPLLLIINSLFFALRAQDPLTPAQIKKLLFDAVRANNLAGVQKAVSLGAKVNSIEQGIRTTPLSTSGWTPLHWAAAYGHERIIRYLLDQGAYAFAEDINNRTPADVAVQNGRPQIAQMLMAEKEAAYLPRSSTYLPPR